MSTEKFETSKVNGVHFQLSRLVGEWEGVTNTWFEPGKLADTSTIRGTIKPVLDGRFVLHEYKGSLTGHLMEGIALYGYHTGTSSFQSAWVDSCHNGTAIMFSRGKKADTYSVLGSYGEELGQPWGWRTSIDLRDDDTLIIMMYNITPQGEEAKAVETTYRRVR